MIDWKVKLIKVLNKFCFAKWHDHNCNGCVFKNCKKCPLNTVVERLEESL